MIYEITFIDGRRDWCTAKDELHLLKSYDKDFELSLQEIESIEELSEEQAKKIIATNIDMIDDPHEEPKKISIWELAGNDDFEILASTEIQIIKDYE
jgi:hypothetical protein